MDILILGSTSNICASRVFDNLNNLHSKIRNIYCYDMKKMDNLDFKNYMINNVKINNTNMILNKIKYIYGEFTTNDYVSKIKDIMND